MNEAFLRTEALIGPEGLERLARAKVAVCGLGGVGSYVAEALARSGVGHLLLVDHDQAAMSNINRQLCALHSTLGQNKTDIMAERIRDIAPDCQVELRRDFLDMDNARQVVGQADYICDAIDHIPGKVGLIRYGREAGIRLVSAMGAGRRVDPTQLRVADISRTHTCPLARNVRRELRRFGIEQGVKVVYSEEAPLLQEGGAIGSMVFVPAAMGMVMAAIVVWALALGE